VGGDGTARKLVDEAIVNLRDAFGLGMEERRATEPQSHRHMADSWIAF
jgi:hypothetical protein